MSKNWPKDRCREAALRYTSRSQFKRSNQSAYVACRKNGWLDDVCAHMRRLGCMANRYVYEIVDSDRRLVYVGITTNVQKRLNFHRRAGVTSVRALLDGHHEVAIGPLMHVEDAVRTEAGKIASYARDGWTVLNTAKAGAIGAARRYWTADRIAAAAASCNSIEDFRTRHPKAYDAARTYDLLKSVCSHMRRRKQANGYWTKARAIAAAKAYRTRNAFRLGAPSAYLAAKRDGYFFEACAHMAGNRAWTVSLIACEALKYQKRSEFERQSLGAYAAACRRGILDQVCGHMAPAKMFGANAR